MLLLFSLQAVCDLPKYTERGFTFVATVFADGSKGLPMFIFGGVKGPNVEVDGLGTFGARVVVRGNPSAFMNRTVMTDYIKSVFADKAGPTLLLLDDYKAHFTAENLAEMKARNIHLYVYPPCIHQWVSVAVGASRRLRESDAAPSCDVGASM